MKYLLPCPCGLEMIVEPRQAGETVRCSCGSSVQAPTLLEIVALEPAPVETQPQPKAPSWGAWHRVMLVGFIFALAAIGMAIWMSVSRPVSRFAFEPEEIVRAAQSMSPPLTWENWLAVKQGLDRRTDTEYPQQLFIYHMKGVVGVGLALAGTALIVIGLLGKRAGRVALPVRE